MTQPVMLYVGNRTFRPFDVLPPGRFAPSLDVLSLWTFCPVPGTAAIRRRRQSMKPQVDVKSMNHRFFIVKLPVAIRFLEPLHLFLVYFIVQSTVTPTRV